jgi:hypothetical protein
LRRHAIVFRGQTVGERLRYDYGRSEAIISQIVPHPPAPSVPTPEWQVQFLRNIQRLLAEGLFGAVNDTTAHRNSMTGSGDRETVASLSHPFGGEV